MYNIIYNILTHHVSTGEGLAQNKEKETALERTKKHMCCPKVSFMFRAQLRPQSAFLFLLIVYVLASSSYIHTCKF